MADFEEKVDISNLEKIHEGKWNEEMERAGYFQLAVENCTAKIRRASFTRASRRLIPELDLFQKKCSSVDEKYVLLREYVEKILDPCISASEEATIGAAFDGFADLIQNLSKKEQSMVSKEDVHLVLKCIYRVIWIPNEENQLKILRLAFLIASTCFSEGDNQEFTAQSKELYQSNLALITDVPFYIVAMAHSPSLESAAQSVAFQLLDLFTMSLRSYTENGDKSKTQSAVENLVVLLSRISDRAVERLDPLNSVSFHLISTLL